MRRQRGKARAIRRRYGRAGYTAKPLAFPNVKSFHELFTSARPYVSKTDINARGVRATRGGSEANTIGHYMVMRGRHGHEALYVSPSPALISYLSNHMLALGDRIYFEVVFRDDNKALILARYNKIIGDKWLALVDASTVPEDRT